MRVSELIEKLIEIEDVGLGDLVVSLYKNDGEVIDIDKTVLVDECTVWLRER